MKNNPTLNELSDVLKKDVDLLLIAGEHSGDELAADLISELKINNPNLSIVGIGGTKMEALNVPLLFNLVNFSVFGFTDVLKNYLFFKTLLANVLDWIQEFSPKHICFIDYPGFNLRLAKELYKKAFGKRWGINTITLLRQSSDMGVEVKASFPNGKVFKFFSNFIAF